MPTDIIDVTELTFEYEVISYSRNVLVLVDFWAPWCRPCKTLSPILEHLASEVKGGFRLAKVDIDENPNLALRFSVRGIPTVKAFSEGNVVAEFVGLLPEARIREFISKLAPPGPAQLALEKGESLLLEGEWKAAEKTFRDILEQHPDQPISLLGLAKALLSQGISDEPLKILTTTFPASTQFKQAETLLPYAKALADFHKNNLPDELDLDPAFQNCIRLASRGKFSIALDGLLDILREDRHFRHGIARLIVVAILELMGEGNPLTRQYRSELASILF